MNSQQTKPKSYRNTRDMTTGKISSQMISFALPIFLSQVFQQLYNTADAFIVGQFLGTKALGAVTSSGTLIFLLTSFFIGTTMGAGIVISRYFGEGNADKVSRAIHTNIAFGLACGVAYRSGCRIYSNTTYMDEYRRGNSSLCNRIFQILFSWRSCSGYV